MKYKWVRICQFHLLNRDKTTPFCTILLFVSAKPQINYKSRPSQPGIKKALPPQILLLQISNWLWGLHHRLKLPPCLECSNMKKMQKGQYYHGISILFVLTTFSPNLQDPLCSSPNCHRQRIHRKLSNVEQNNLRELQPHCWTAVYCSLALDSFRSLFYSKISYLPMPWPWHLCYSLKANVICSHKADYCQGA